MTSTQTASVESRMAPTTPNAPKVTQISKTDTVITYRVEFLGEVLGEIERTVWAERRRFAGQMYGYDMARKPHFRISKVGTERSGFVSYHDQRQNCVNWLFNMIKH